MKLGSIALVAMLPGLLATCISCAPVQAPSSIDRVATHWFSLHNDFRDTADVWGNYTLDLTLEALLAYDLHRGHRHYTPKVEAILRKRGISPGDTLPYRTQPFCSIPFAMGQATGDSLWYRGFLAESYRMYEETPRSAEGAIMLVHQGKPHLLIDYLQEYASRLARAGALTGDTALFADCVRQFVLYEGLVRQAETGLWSQGRGFCPDDSSRLGTGAWSRGHGWLLRGLVGSMRHLPETYQAQLRPILDRVSTAVLAWQAEDGLFHVLLHLPPDQSPPDVSGSGMIAYAWAIALKEGWLEARTYAPAVRRVAAALPAYVGTDGTVFSSCEGPGPLCEDSAYRDYSPPPDEKHGFQGMIYGLIAGEMMRE